jgi:hypothetical protein
MRTRIKILPSKVKAPCAGIDAVREANAVVLRCQRCSEAWSYPTGKDYSGAMTLRLMDHVASHEEECRR